MPSCYDIKQALVVFFDIAVTRSPEFRLGQVELTTVLSHLTPDCARVLSTVTAVGWASDHRMQIRQTARHPLVAIVSQGAIA
jgi:hypothetical protein